MAKSQFIPHLLLILILIIAYSVFLLTPISLYDNDFTRHQAYGDLAALNTLKTYGIIGLWDTISGNGSPQIGLVSYLFYPLISPLYPFLGVLISLKIATVLHLALSACAFLYLAKTLKISSLAAFFGAIFYTVNYYVQSNVNIGVMVEIFNMLWMPLTIAFTWKALFEKKTFFAFLAGIALAMHILAMTLYAILFTGIIIGSIIICYLAVRLRSEGMNSLFTVVKFVLISSTTALGISAIKLFPMLEYASYSVRSGGQIYASGNPLHQGFTSMTASEGLLFFFNLLVPSNKLLHISSAINFFFLFFILYGIKKRSIPIIFLLLFLVSLISMMGRNSPIDFYSLFYHFLPGMGSFEEPLRFRILTNLLAPLLFVFGLSAFWNKKRKLHIKALTICLLFISSAYLIFYTNKQHVLFYKPNHFKAFAEQQKDSYPPKIISEIMKSEDEVLHIFSTYENRDKSVYGVSAFNYNFLITNPPFVGYTLNYQYYPSSLNMGNVFFEKNNFSFEKNSFVYKKYKFLSLLNTKYLAASENHDDYPNPFIFPFQKINGGTLYRLKNFLPFVSFPENTILFIGKGGNTPQKIRYLLLQNDFDIQNISFVFYPGKKMPDYSEKQISTFDLVILDTSAYSNEEVESFLKRYGKESELLPLTFHQKEYLDFRANAYSLFSESPFVFLKKNDLNAFNNKVAILPKRSTKNINFRLVEYSPRKIAFSVTTNQEKTFARISDTFYPGWKAYDNGKEIQVLFSDSIIKGIFIEGKGKHAISLHFTSSSYMIGKTITLASILILVFLLLLKGGKIRVSK